MYTHTHTHTHTGSVPNSPAGIRRTKLPTIPPQSSPLTPQHSNTTKQAAHLASQNVYLKRATTSPSDSEVSPHTSAVVVDNPVRDRMENGWVADTEVELKPPFGTRPNATGKEE